MASLAQALKSKMKIFQSSDGMNNIYVWILAFFPLVFFGLGTLTYWAETAGEFDGPIGVGLVAMLFVCVFVNWFLVSKDAEVNSMQFYFVWEKLLIPVYLVKRAKKMNGSYAPLIVWCIMIVLSFVMIPVVFAKAIAPGFYQWLFDLIPVLPALFAWIGSHWLILLLTIGAIVIIDIPLILIIEHYLPSKLSTILSTAVVLISGILLFFFTDIMSTAMAAAAS